jgi:hypothetical protein
MKPEATLEELEDYQAKVVMAILKVGKDSPKYTKLGQNLAIVTVKIINKVNESGESGFQHEAQKTAGLIDWARNRLNPTYTDITETMF